MSINSSAVSYNFGQLGSVVSNVAKPVVPPKGMVITAIQFLSDNTPTALVSEKRVSSGAGFPNITGSTDAVGAADGFMNHNGVTTAAATGSNSGAVVTISAANNKIKVGQYVLIVNDSDEVIARCWNGGPKGGKRKATLHYWNKVKKHIK